MNSEYKKYSLDNLKTWIQDSLSSGGASPKEIYDAICEAVDEEYHIYKHHTSQCYELLGLLNGNGSSILNQVKTHGELWDKEDIDAILGEREYCGEQKLTCDKDDNSPECQQAWTSFWEEHYYPEEVKDDGMRPWGHSDLEYGLANSVLTEDRISNFPGEQYSEEELNAMCDKAASEQEKEKCREYNLREAEYYNKRAKLDAEYTQAKIQANSPYNDGWTQEYYQNIVDKIDANPGPHQSYIGWKNISESQFNEMFSDKKKFKDEISRNDTTRIDYESGYVYESPDGGKTVTKRKVGTTEKIIVKKEKVNKWVIPVNVDGLTGDCYVNLPDDLLEVANLKEGDEIEWVEQKDGSYLLKKVFKLISMDEC